MKIKMTTSAITDKCRYYHGSVLEVGVNISKELAESMIKANYARVVEEDKPEKSPEPKKTRTKKTVNED